MEIKFKKKKASNYQANIKALLSPHYMQTIKKKYKSSNFTAEDVLQLFSSVVLKHRLGNGDCPTASPKNIVLNGAKVIADFDTLNSGSPYYSTPLRFG